MTAGGRGAGSRASAVRTFLIADIRGYTRFTAQHGDEAASRLARRFADVAAEGVVAWGGELVELRGDEALAVFDSARKALRCAVELQDAFADETNGDPDLPLSVGIGLDAGEAVPVDDGYRGAALNMAARLCASANGGETIASANIVHLAGPVAGLAFGDLTKRMLKGIDEPVEAAVVTDVGQAAQASGRRVATPSMLAATSSETGGLLPVELEPVVPLIGRESELTWLRWHWRRARHGHGRTVVVSGPPGIGKTRLAAELGTIANVDRALVSYVPSNRPAKTDDHATQDEHLQSLIVFDDVDAASSASQHAVVEASTRAPAIPRLLVVIHREEAAVALRTVIDQLAPPDRRQTLGPLEPDGVRAIVALYAGQAAEGAPLRQLMDDSGGVPAAIHRVAATWARNAATHRLGDATERTDAGRRNLRAAEDALIGDVADLEGIRDRTRRFDPDGPATSGHTICPYKGLASFDQVDAAYYFGRDRLVAELVARLVGNGFLGFVGASGSGKSSALRAGLLPALAGGVLPGSDRWVPVVMRPGEHPLAELAQALARALPDDPRAGLEPADPLKDALSRLGEGQGLILAVDQFEEAFAATGGEAERGAFIELLTTPRDGLRVIVTMRADHYGHCAAYPALARLISSSHVLVGPLTTVELEAVIEAPAERVGLRVEPELVKELVADAGSEPGVLPLLSTALLELWQARAQGWLTVAAYRAGGGLHGAVARLAESAYAELDPGQASIARSMFLRLAGTGEGEGLVRRRVSLAELDVEGDPAVARVLEMLTEARLLTTGDGYVEVAHEALLREWPRLQRWLEEDAEGRRLRLHLIGAARDWDQRHRQPADLYRGARLSAALDWAAEHQVDLNTTEREFLEASRLTSEREVENERRTNRRLRLLLGGAAGLLVVAVAAGGFALIQASAAREQQGLAERREAEAESARQQAETAGQQAETAARFARSRELAASSTAELDKDPALAKLLAVAAADVAPPDIDTESALHQAWSADHTVDRWAWPHDAPFENLITDLHPEGGLMVASGDQGKNNHTLMVVDLPGDRVVWSFQPDWPQAEVEFARFTPDGSHVVAGVFWAPWDDATSAPPPDALGLFIWDTATGRLIKRVDTGPCGAKVKAVATGVAVVSVLRDDPGYTPGCYAVDGDHPAQLESVDLTTGKRSVLSTKASDDAALSRDGRFAAFTDFPDFLVVDLATGKRVLQLDGSKIEGVSYVRELNADGTLLLYGDRPLTVFDVATGTKIATLANGAGEHFGVGFGSETTVYSTGTDASLSAWDATNGALLFKIPAAGGGRPSVAADGRVLVSDYISGQATLIDPRKRGELGTVETCPGFIPAFQLEVANGVGAFSIGCDGGPNETLVVDTKSLATTTTLLDTDGQDIALSADGTRFAAGTSADDIMRPLRIYDAQTAQPLVELKGLCAYDFASVDAGRLPAGCKAFPETPFGTWPFSMVFSPDGRYLAELDVGVAVWDATTGELLMAIEAPGPWSAIFTPDSTELLVSTGEGELLAISTERWEVTRRAKLDESVAEGGRIGLTGFLPDGKTLIGVSGAGGSGGGSLHRIDLDTLKILSSNRAHDGAPKASRLSEDGKLLVTGAADGVVRVWDAATGTLLDQLHVDGQAQGVAFLDDERIAVAPQAGELLVFSVEPQALLHAVRASIQRGFTPEECARFKFEDHCPTLDESRGMAP